MTELLAPAGDLERLKIALLYGADAVYIGGSLYGLRANATNFTIDEIKEGVKFAHNLNKKVYVTVNIVLHNKEIKNLKDYLKQLDNCGVDAIIVSDLSIIIEAKKHTNLEIHLSTQASTLNIEAARFYKKLGVKRIVLAREMTYEEIKEIRKNVDIDIECFIHGAMCASYSGRCVLSNFLTNRDANRGGCAQICRFTFDIGEDVPFTMATKDLNMSKNIGNLIEAGARSLKIEGRMRSNYYLATVISSYRKIIDNYYAGTLTEEILDREEKILSRVANRETSTHYYLKEADYTDQYYTGRSEVSNQDYLGQVISFENNLIKFYERNYFEKGDTIEVFTPNHEKETFVVERLLNDDKNEIDVARHPDNIYYVELKSKITIPEYSMLRIVKRNK